MRRFENRYVNFLLGSVFQREYFPFFFGPCMRAIANRFGDMRWLGFFFVCGFSCECAG